MLTLVDMKNMLEIFPLPKRSLMYIMSKENGMKEISTKEVCKYLMNLMRTSSFQNSNFIKELENQW